MDDKKSTRSGSASGASNGTDPTSDDGIDAAQVPVPGDTDDTTLKQAADEMAAPHYLSELTPVAVDPLPICIIGFKHRFPFAEDDAFAFWDVLIQDVDCTSETPKSRFDPEQWPDIPRRGGFLKDPTAFEPEAFGMRKREAASTDPQQFMTLECSLGALEHAGLPPEKLAGWGMRVGVYIGRMNNDAEQMFHETEAGPSTAAGVAGSISAAVVSYRFDQSGPNMVLDTACSSSLVAVDSANLALYAKRADVFLVGGVNWLGNVKVWEALVRAGMVSERCLSFSKDAKGYGRGEGCGLLALARADFSHANGYASHAQIVGSSVNSDGRGTSPITKPHGPKQAECARAAWGGLVEECRIIEAHGTGTVVGDPVEAGGIATVFGKAEGGGPRTLVGAVKSNMNHLESASGMVGLMKVQLQLQQGVSVPFGTRHWDPSNSSVDFGQMGLLVSQVVAKCWDNSESPRYAGVNSFGFGGTNAHVALASAPDPAASHREYLTQGEGASGRQEWAMGAGYVAVVLSAVSQEGLRKTLQHTLEHEKDDVLQLAINSAVRRSHGERLDSTGIGQGIVHPFRAAIVVDTKQGPAQLDSLLHGMVPTTSEAKLAEIEEESKKQPKPPKINAMLAGLWRAGVPVTAPPRVVFAFAGNGAAWPGMLQTALLDKYPPMRRKVEELAKCFRKCDPNFDLFEVLSRANEVLPEDPYFTQPLLFACEVAQVELWAAWGVKPDAVVGHSAGETGAAYAAGYLSLEDAAKVTLCKAAMQRHAMDEGLGGGMAAVKMPMNQLEQILPEGAEIAAENSQEWCTVGGSDDALKILATQLPAHAHFKRLAVPIAYHTSALSKYAGAVGRELQLQRQSNQTHCKMYSTVTGKLLEPEAISDGKHWEESIAGMVHFRSAMKACLQEIPGDNRNVVNAVCIELGPKRQLETHIVAIAEDLPEVPLKVHVVQSSAEGAEGEANAPVEAAALLWQLGAPINWDAVYKGDKGFPAPTTSLPGRLPERQYARTADAYESPQKNKEYRAMGPSAQLQQHVVAAESAMATRPLQPVHEVAYSDLTLLELSDEGATLSVSLDQHRTPEVFDHRLGGSVLVPGAFYIDLALKAATVMGMPCTGTEVEIDFETGGFVEKMAIKELVVSIHASGAFTIKGRGTNVLYAAGHCTPVQSGPRGPPFPFQHIPDSDTEEVSPDDLYGALDAVALTYGPTLRRVMSCRWCRKLKAGLATICLTEEQGSEVEHHALHPALGDLFLQLLGLLLRHLGKELKCKVKALPMGVESIVVHDHSKLSKEMVATIRLDEVFHNTIIFSGELCTMDGEVVVSFRHGSAQWLGKQPEEALRELFWQRGDTPLPKQVNTVGHRKMRCIIFMDQELVANRMFGGWHQLSNESVWIPSHCRNSAVPALLYQHLKLPGLTIQEFDAILFCWTGDGLRIGDDGRESYDRFCRDMERLQELIKYVQKEKRPWPFVWQITSGTPMLPSSPPEANNPFGAAFNGFGQSLETEDVLADGPLHQSKLRTMEISSSDDQNIAAARLEIQGPRDDCADIVLHSGAAHRIEILETDCSLAELQGRTSHMRALPQAAPMEVHFASDMGAYITERASEGSTAECGDTVVEVSEAKAEEELAIEVSGVILHPEAHFAHLPVTCVGNQQAGPVRMLDFAGEANGEAVVACAPRPVCFGHTTVHPDLTLPNELLPWGSGPSLSDLVVANEILNRLGMRQGSDRLAVAPMCDGQSMLVSALKRMAACRQNAPQVELLQPEARGGSSFDAMVIEGPPGQRPELRHMLKPGGISLHLCSYSDEALKHASSQCLIFDARGELQEAQLRRAVPQIRQDLQKHTDASSIIEPVQPWGEVQDLDEALAKKEQARVHLNRRSLRARVRQPRGRLFSKDKSYLVVGARPENFGGFTAKLLAEHGAGHVFLLVRSQPNAATLRAIVQNLPGVKVTYIVADICSDEGERFLFERLRNERLDGVFHAAAEFHDGLFNDRRHSFGNDEKVLKPKVLLTIALHRATSKHDLSYFFLHSSVSAVTGNHGQSAYAAGNAFQDAFARWRRNQGLAGQSAQWTSLDGMGVLLRTGLAKHLEETRGFAAFKPETIRMAFEALLLYNLPNMVAAKFVWHIIQNLATAKNRLVHSRFHTLDLQYGRISVEVPGSDVAVSTPELRIATQSARQPAASNPVPAGQEVQPQEAAIAKVFQEEFNFDPALFETHSLVDLGLHSQWQLEARELLSKKFQIVVPLDMLLSDEPTAQLIGAIIALHK